MSNFQLIPWLVEKLSIPIKIDNTNLHIASAIVVVLFIIIISFISWLKLKNTERNLVPTRKITFASLFEIIAEALLKIMTDLIGDTAKNYFNLIGSVFIFIFICNLTGVIPGFIPPTSNINTNLAVALCVFTYYNYVGVKKHGFIKYLKHLGGPVIWLAPLIFVIELVSQAFRPISLSVRLFGNVFGDHVVLEIFSDLTPILIPIFFMLLTIFVAFIQAFVFTLLSIVYIAFAVQEEQG